MHPACALDCAFNKCDAVFCDSCTSNHACRKKGMVLQSVTLDDDSDSDLSREVTVFMAVKYTMHSDGGYDDDEAFFVAQNRFFYFAQFFYTF